MLGEEGSNLVAPAGASNATLALYATYWTAMLQGWSQGIASVDPSLNAGLYANQSEYRNYNLAAQPLPKLSAKCWRERERSYSEREPLRSRAIRPSFTW